MRSLAQKTEESLKRIIPMRALTDKHLFWFFYNISTDLAEFRTECGCNCSTQPFNIKNYVIYNNRYAHQAVMCQFLWTFSMSSFIENHRIKCNAIKKWNECRIPCSIRSVNQLQCVSCFFSNFNEVIWLMCRNSILKFILWNVLLFRRSF